MSGTFWRDVLVDFLGGATAGLVILCFAEKVFGIRKEAMRRKKEREADTERARTYLGLLRDEVKGMEKWIPDQLTNLRSKKWGMAVPIQTPVWDVVQQAGELVSLVEPGLLKRTAFFYERLEVARWAMDFLLQSWLAPKDVTGLDKKQAEAAGKVEEMLERDLEMAPGLVKSLEKEIVLLGGQLEGTGQG